MGGAVLFDKGRLTCLDSVSQPRIGLPMEPYGSPYASDGAPYTTPNELQMIQLQMELHVELHVELHMAFDMELHMELHMVLHARYTMYGSKMITKTNTNTGSWNSKESR